MTIELDTSGELRRLARDLVIAAERLDSLARALVGTSQTAANPSGDSLPVAPRLFTVPEVMERLSLGRATVYNLIRTGELASIKIGRSRRVTPAALNDYIRSR